MSAEELKPRFNDFNEESPVVEGGISDREISRLIEEGWEVRILNGDRQDVPVAFKNIKVPGGIQIKYGTVADGTIVIENDELGVTIIKGCGNPCPILNEDYTVP